MRTQSLLEGEGEGVDFLVSGCVDAMVGTVVGFVVDSLGCSVVVLLIIDVVTADVEGGCVPTTKSGMS